MKKNKVEKTYIYFGFGFPIVLEDVPMIQVRGTFTPDINYNVLQKVVLLALCHQSAPLTGNQIRFIRKYYELTLEAFASKFGITHAAVLKWEKKGDHPAKMMLGFERDIRLFVLDRLLTDAKDFRLAFRKILDQSFNQLEPEPLHVDVPTELALRTG